MNIIGNSNTVITGNYNLTVKHNSATSINIKSTNGGITLESGDINTYGNEIKINSNIQFNNALYYKPEILQAPGNSNSAANREIIGQNVLSVLSWNGTLSKYSLVSKIK